jgi:hypothetical protein
MENGYLYVEGNVNLFCPHCGSILWNEIPDGLKCNVCKGEITSDVSKRTKVTINYIKKLTEEHSL